MSSLKNMSRFFGSKENTRFLVVGASTNPAKFGYKVLNWYHKRDLPVTPVNPTAPEILGIPVSKSVAVYAADFPESRLSISVITPPAVSSALVDDLVQLKERINAIWFQPGSYDAETVRSLQQHGLLADHVIYQGSCILVSGDDGLREYYGKDQTKL